MHNRIPPPAYFIAAAIVMKLLDQAGLGIPLSIPYATRFAGLLAALAASVIAAAIISFRRARTTVDPLNPSAASALVRSGVFRWSRNPMYLGLTTMLVAGAVYLQSVTGLIVATLFAVLITAWQIKPEERALRELFGREFDDYCREVRRWI